MRSFLIQVVKESRLEQQKHSRAKADLLQHSIPKRDQFPQNWSRDFEYRNTSPTRKNNGHSQHPRLQTKEVEVDFSGEKRATTSPAAGDTGTSIRKRQSKLALAGYGTVSSRTVAPSKNRRQ